MHSRFSNPLVNLDNNGNIHAEIYMKKSDDISVNKLKESGVKVEYNDTHFNIATCWIPFDTVEYIAKDNNESTAVYKGNDIKTSNFTVTLKEAGTYTIRVDGDKHTGGYLFYWGK